MKAWEWHLLVLFTHVCVCVGGLCVHAGVFCTIYFKTRAHSLFNLVIALVDLDVVCIG